ncbi:hypothetical protein [Tahibacter sp.]|uniref:hypothetical protein n=1 Tax=Tahibacter sp. TaxID=2056211 RepID=UPI0028C4A092|nr:hypothetical protein [Tahibacter sp.]
MNIILGTLSLAAVAFLSLSPQIPDAFRTGVGNTVVFALSTGLLIAWSVLALMGKPWARYLMLAAALLFYGGILIQNIQIYRSAADAHLATAPLIAQVAAGVIEIVINLWALLSAKTRRYFEHAASAAGRGRRTP